VEKYIDEVPGKLTDFCVAASYLFSAARSSSTLTGFVERYCHRLLHGLFFGRRMTRADLSVLLVFVHERLDVGAHGLATVSFPQWHGDFSYVV
jgi:hypothetical protein